MGGGDQIKNNHGFCIKHMTIYISNGCKERKKFLPAQYIPLPLLTLAGEGGGGSSGHHFSGVYSLLYTVLSFHMCDIDQYILRQKYTNFFVI